ncbi:hypothetical protein CR513_47198, partial [Mucuna pruriens]
MVIVVEDGATELTPYYKIFPTSKTKKKIKWHKAQFMSHHPSTSRVGQHKLRATNEASLLHSSSLELKPLPGHLKYAYLDNDQQFPVIIANNLHREQKEKLLQVLRQHKKAIG